MTRIGFVGLGSMGTPLAGRLLPGNEVQGTNRAADNVPDSGPKAA